MKKCKAEEMAHEAINDTVMGVLEGVPGIRFVVRLDEVLLKRNLTQQQLSALTGIRPAAISEFIKGNKSGLNKIHLMAIMVALRITNIFDIINIEFDEETKAQFDKEAEEWIETGEVPLSVKELYENNMRKKAF